MDRDEIERQEFPPARRGYDTAAVREHLRAGRGRVRGARPRARDQRRSPRAASAQVRAILEAAEAGRAAAARRGGPRGERPRRARGRGRRGCCWRKLDRLQGGLDRLLGGLKATADTLSDTLGELSRDRETLAAAVAPSGPPSTGDRPADEEARAWSRSTWRSTARRAPRPRGSSRSTSTCRTRPGCWTTSTRRSGRSASPWPQASPPELAPTLAELGDLPRAAAPWDQNTYMPPGGAEARAEQLATLERLAHVRLVDPELVRLLDALEPGRPGADPDSDDVRLVADRAPRPREGGPRAAGARGRDGPRGGARLLGARVQAREAGGLRPLPRPARAPGSSCAAGTRPASPDAQHPYDVLLDDYEPGMTTAEVRSLFGRAVLGPAPARRGGRRRRRRRPTAGRHERRVRPRRPARRPALGILGEIGFEEGGASTPRRTRSHRVARRRRPASPHATARNHSPRLLRQPARDGPRALRAGHPATLRARRWASTSLGFHESRAACGRTSSAAAAAFCAWVLPHLQEQLPGLEGRRRASTAASTPSRSLIRVEADEMTYNLHIMLRFELELALLEGRWRSPTCRPPGTSACRVPRPRRPRRRAGRAPGRPLSGGCRLLPDLHAGQPYRRPVLRARSRGAAGPRRAVRAGDFARLLGWLRERVHVHGRKFTQRELLRAGHAPGAERGAVPRLPALSSSRTPALLTRSAPSRNPTTRLSYTSGSSWMASVWCASGEVPVLDRPVPRGLVVVDVEVALDVRAGRDQQGRRLDRPHLGPRAASSAGRPRAAGWSRT